MKRVAVALSVVAAVLPLAALGQLRPEEAIRARQSIMRVVSLAFAPLGRMGSGDAPFDREVFQGNAARLEAVWGLNPVQYFVPGTDKPVQGSRIASFTAARPEIWASPDRFKAVYDAATQAVKGVADAARSGDEKAMRVAAGELGKRCKACHDDFRAR